MQACHDQLRTVGGLDMLLADTMPLLRMSHSVPASTLAANLGSRTVMGSWEYAFDTLKHVKSLARIGFTTTLLVQNRNVINTRKT
jgi:hypothetical protein